MDKEQLKTKVEALQDNLKVKHDELTEVQQFEFQIYIPNCDYWDPDNEYFNTYALTDEMTGHTFDFDRADEVVEHIQDCTRDVIFTN